MISPSSPAIHPVQVRTAVTSVDRTSSPSPSPGSRTYPETVVMRNTTESSSFCGFMDVGSTAGEVDSITPGTFWPAGGFPPPPWTHAVAVATSITASGNAVVSRWFMAASLAI